ncbi:MAG: VWA domain-containing protein [Deltaproteobacteria bacterium]
MDSEINYTQGRFRYLVCILSVVLLSNLPNILRAQSAQATKDKTSEPVSTLRTTTRLVTLEVVVKDGHGKHVENLKADDFQIFEQTLSQGKQKYEQKIAAFHEVHVADLSGNPAAQTRLPDGSYTNLVAMQKDPVPPTILLVDGLNTELKYQAQVHVQMIKMLRSLPSNVPTAVFLFGHRLQMLQDFTTDPRLLQDALTRAVSPAVKSTMQIPPDLDPDSVSGQLARMKVGPGVSPPADLVAAVEGFEKEVYAANMDMRVRVTLSALTSLGLHVAGYPGRKNLLWISTTFPIALGAGDDRNYFKDVLRCSHVLSQAKMVVYPINPAGVQPPEVYDAGARVRQDVPFGTQLQRYAGIHQAEQPVMQLVADRTGGRICTENNDLGDCVRRAVDDSSSFYEIAYYSDSPYWNGEYRNVIVNAKQHGLRLEYRQGYFASPEGEKSTKEQQAELQQAACEDYMNATAIFMAAKPVPPDSPENPKFLLLINASALTLVPAGDGDRDLNVVVAACTFDKKGWPLKFMHDNIHRKLGAKEFESLMTSGLPHLVVVPGEKAAAVRLLVKDIPSGRLGSVNIKLADLVAAPPEQ